MAASPLLNLSQATFNDLLRIMSNDANERGISRAYMTGLGDTNYDLQRPAKSIVPYFFPVSALTPDVIGDGDVATHFKTFTGVNTTGIEGWIAEGLRQAQITSTLTSTTVNYATMGLEDGVTWEAVGAGQGFEDVRNRMQTQLMMATLQIKE